MGSDVATAADTRRPRVYLAGPIDNVDHDAAEGWRADAAASLAPAVDTVDPYAENPEWPAALAGRKRLREWCFRQSRDCDAVLVANLGPETVTRGTAMEIREAETAGTPIVVQAPDPDACSEMVAIPATAVVATLDEAIGIVHTIVQQPTEVGHVE